MRRSSLLVLVVALLTGLTPPALAQLLLQGRVLDDADERPIFGARVFLLNRYSKTIGYAVTDDLGRFEFQPGEAGRLRLEAKALGYSPTVTPALWMVEDRAFAGVEIRLAAHAVLLAPVEVVALSPPKGSPVLENVVFRRTRGFGYQITREEIEKRNPLQLSDILQEAPGVYAERRGSGTSGRVIRMGRSLAGPGGGGCPVQIFLDGMLATRDVAGGDVAVDDLVSPADVEVIEVFRGLASVPPEFLNPKSRCGVIAIWTKRSLP